MLTRRTQLGLLFAGTVAAAKATPTEKDHTMFQELFEASQKEKKGLLVYVKGQSIPGLVIKIGADSIELRSREYSRIIVRIDAIDAVAMS